MRKININDIFIMQPFDTGELANWCRDNYFLVKRSPDNKRFLFIDSYWGFADVNAKKYTFKELHKLGHCHFYFNANEVRKIEKGEFERYEKSDRFIVPEQHGSVTKYLVRKDATQSQRVILSLIDRDIEEEKNNVKQAHRRLTWLAEKRSKVEAGELGAY